MVRRRIAIMQQKKDVMNFYFLKRYIFSIVKQVKTNLQIFSFSLLQITEEIDESEQWKEAYMTGAGHELYAATFSQSFVGMSFKEAVE